VRSHKLAKMATQALHTRLAKAQAELGRLAEHKQGKKRYADGAALQQAAQTILCPSSLWGSSFTGISLLCPPYNSASSPC